MASRRHASFPAPARALSHHERLHRTSASSPRTNKWPSRRHASFPRTSARLYGTRSVFIAPVRALPRTNKWLRTGTRPSRTSARLYRTTSVFITPVRVCLAPTSAFATGTRPSPHSAPLSHHERLHRTSASLPRTNKCLRHGTRSSPHQRALYRTTSVSIAPVRASLAPTSAFAPARVLTPHQPALLYRTTSVSIAPVRASLAPTSAFAPARVLTSHQRASLSHHDRLPRTSASSPRTNKCLRTGHASFPRTSAHLYRTTTVFIAPVRACLAPTSAFAPARVLPRTSARLYRTTSVFLAPVRALLAPSSAFAPARVLPSHQRASLSHHERRLHRTSASSPRTRSVLLLDQLPARDAAWVQRGVHVEIVPSGVVDDGLERRRVSALTAHISKL